MEKVGESERKLEKVGESWKKLEKVRSHRVFSDCTVESLPAVFVVGDTSAWGKRRETKEKESRKERESERESERKSERETEEKPKREYQ